MTLNPVPPKYIARNDRRTCICGYQRIDIGKNIWFVGEHGGAVWAPYYYRCPICYTFSAVNLYFSAESYQECRIEDYSIPDDKRELNRQRVQWILDHAEVPQDATIYDLGAGEGAFTQAFVQALPGARVVSVEADVRMPRKFHTEYEGATVVEDYIEPFLSSSEIAGSADVIVLTDVLEHVLNPDEMLASIIAALKPGGVAYVTVPNSDSLLHQEHVSDKDVSWDRANTTYQHLWVTSPREMVRLFERTGLLAEYTQALETRIRCDSQYSTFLLRK
jgi:2-polyprenyl-3-methyl-5-hydroxy-6-metoxy-1,4-benzoquinol methylase